MKFEFNSLLKNKYVLYIVFFFTITNLFGYLMMNNFNSIIFFAMAGFLTSYFSKNMIIILMVALISTNFFTMTKMVGKTIKEGMTDPKKNGKPKAPSKAPPKAPAKAPAKAAPLKNTQKPALAKKTDPKKPAAKPKPVKEQMASANLDGSYDIDVRDINTNKPKINFASTLESAYDNLDKLLSSDAIGKMSLDTQRLAEKQQLLMGNIDKLSPLMKTAEDLLSGLNVDKMGDMLTGMKGKLDKFTNMGMGVGMDLLQ
jgi:hypothetical protein